MKFYILLALVASTQAMDTVPIASLIELNINGDPEPVSGSGLMKNKRICKSWSDKSGETNCVEPDGLNYPQDVTQLYIEIKKDDDESEKKEEKLKPLDDVTNKHADDAEFRICNGLNAPCHEIDNWVKNHSNDASTNTKAE